MPHMIFVPRSAVARRRGRYAWTSADFLILPESVFGNDSLISMIFGTLGPLQPLAAMQPNLALRERRLTARHDDRLDAHPVDLVGNADDCGLTDARQLIEHVLDLLRADLLPTAHEDVVSPTDEVQETVVVHPELIAGVEEHFAQSSPSRRRSAVSSGLPQ